MRTAVVFVGGPHGAGTAAQRALDGVDADLVVAIDSGLHLAAALGWHVDLVVGDMDSVDPMVLADAVAAGAAVQRHPVDKDATDLELGLDSLLRAGVESAVIVGSAAGRMDHLIGGVLTLAAPRYSSIAIRAWLGDASMVVVHDTCELHGIAGAVVSIIATNGPASGVRTDGLRWPLRGEVLESGTSRGLSNEFLGDVARVSVDGGCVVVVVPEEEHS